MPRKPANHADDDLLTDFKTLVSDTERLLQHTAELAGDQAGELRQQLQDNLRRARETLHGVEESLLERGRATVAGTEDYVREHPWQSLGVSAGVGFLLGLLAGRR
ncbi:MAG TPA: YqjD family protein [Pseudomonas sp.]|nr:YqjD family protein [Pseudomonas sp.]